MMKVVLVVLIFLHAAIHIIGFVKAKQLSKVEDLKLDIPEAQGWFWLAVSFLLVASAIAYIANWPVWWAPAIITVILSQVLILFSWQDAKFGTAINIILLFALAIAFGQWNFERKAKNIVREFIDEKNNTVVFFDLKLVPEIIGNWRESCATESPVRVAKLEQRGEMKTSQDGSWRNFRATQWISSHTPEFLWLVDVGESSVVQFSGFDQLMNSSGSMKISAYGLLPVVSSRGESIDEASAIRYLAEMVWSPESIGIVPVDWEVLSANRARASLTVDEFSVSGIFTFNDEDRPVKFEAMRYNEQTGKPEKWVVNIDPESYRDFNGSVIPEKASITWEFEHSVFEWYRVEVISREELF